MFKFLYKSNEDKTPKEDYIAKITYYISKENESMVDISLENYEDKSINALCELINILSKDTIVVETINIIKHFLLKDNKQEELMKIFLCIEDIVKMSENISGEKPIIKPSEMLKK